MELSQKKKSLGNKGFLCVRIFFPFCFVWRFFLGGARGRGMEKEFNHQNAGAKKKVLLGFLELGKVCVTTRGVFSKKKRHRKIMGSNMPT